MSYYKSPLPTVLLMEPDPELFEFFTKLLSNVGLEVIMIPDEAGLLELSESECRAIRVALIDEPESSNTLWASYCAIYERHNLKPAPVVLIASMLRRKDGAVNPIEEAAYHVMPKMDFNFEILVDTILSLVRR